MLAILISLMTQVNVDGGALDLNNEPIIKLEFQDAQGGWHDIREGSTEDLSAFLPYSDTRCGILINTAFRITNLTNRSVRAHLPGSSYINNLAPNAARIGQMNYDWFWNCERRFSRVYSRFQVRVYFPDMTTYQQTKLPLSSRSFDIDFDNSTGLLEYPIGISDLNLVFPQKNRSTTNLLYLSAAELIFMGIPSLSANTQLTLPVIGRSRYLTESLEDASDRFFVADFTGDKEDDLLVLKNNGDIEMIPISNLNLGQAQRTATHFNSENGWFSEGLRNQKLVGDVNGDGKADLVFFRRSGRLEVFLSDGQRFYYSGSTMTSLSEQNGWFARDRQRLVYDIDGDGPAELLAIDDFGNLRVYRFNGVAFAYSTAFQIPFESFAGLGAVIPLGDLNLDGEPDLEVTSTYHTEYGDQTLARTISVREDLGHLNHFYAGYAQLPWSKAEKTATSKVLPIHRAKRGDVDLLFIRQNRIHVARITRNPQYDLGYSQFRDDFNFILHVELH